jgi:hypothetical protein
MPDSDGPVITSPALRLSHDRHEMLNAARPALMSGVPGVSLSCALVMVEIPQVNTNARMADFVLQDFMMLPPNLCRVLCEAVRIDRDKLRHRRNRQKNRSVGDMRRSATNA